MIDPIIFTVQIGSYTFSLYWYGVLIMLGVAVAAWLAGREFEKRGQDSNYIWDSLLWVLPAGIIGSRLWYVMNTTLGGDMRYIQDPISILNLKQGGLHYFGALLFGAVAFLIYARKTGLDFWLAIDSLAPGLLLGQAIGRPANWINQELYGQPTTLPWGISIDAAHRIAPYNNLNLYPEDVTRFHPSFAYEMLWNFFAVAILLYIARKYKEKLRPGVIFGGWLILAGVGRNLIEFFRPDQPTFPGTAFSYSRLVAILMILGGVILILIQYKVLKIKFLPASAPEYKLIPPLEEQLEARKALRDVEKEAGNGDEEGEPEEDVEEVEEEKE